MRVIVFGASGFIGKHLTAALRARGDEVVESSLRDPARAARDCAGCDAAVNLSGESLAQRWTNAVKQRVIESRTVLPGRFFDALESVQPRPHAYVSASAIGYYGTSEEATFTEESPPGNDFLANVCVQWERAAQRGAQLGMRVACVRCGLVLGNDGGALARLLPLFKIGTGGRAGNGRQWYSWVHVDDAVGIYLMAIDASMDGALNATAPNPVRNSEFTDVLAGVLRRPAALPAPAMMVKMALGEGATLILEGQCVFPQRTLAEGYVFRFPELRPALEDIVHV